MNTRKTLRTTAFAAAFLLAAAGAAPAVAGDNPRGGGPGMQQAGDAAAGKGNPGKANPGKGNPGKGNPGKGNPGKGHGKPDASEKLRQKVTVKNVVRHLDALQAAADANGGNRAAGTPGYEASGRYIEQQLRKAGYKPVRQPFSYEQFELESETLEQVSPTARTYTAGTDYSTMSYSGPGNVTAPVTAVDVNLTGDRASTSGCEAADFTGFTPGDIALMQRGICSFEIKVQNAAAAGASAAVVFNQGNTVPGEDRTGLLNGTVGTQLSAIPAVSATFALGEELAGTPGAVLHLDVASGVRVIESFNILADTRGGDPDRTVVVGAHLDSVTEGPGINDNGTGSAATLETAVQLAKTKPALQNRVRFAFWGGEEDGLVGSEYYVSQLDAAGIAGTLLNLNFDMVGSPNFGRFIYDGDGSAFGTKGPAGSDVIEAVFEDYFASQNLTSAPTAFSGRSDYAGFIANRIPAGGLFTGAEGLKTAEEAALFGGTAGAPYDACYHAECDDITNVNRTVLDQMSDAVAHAVVTFALTEEELRSGAQARQQSVPAESDYRGHQLLK
ncbi:M20/M25/M40 family metallo-hydrolase [Arthrobacter zhangbolii]|uniref:M20/M25/M40 family metallo-hydrolase n=1 Tax=Arthrobacter zhangbolii TaxID=2886936 RepID=A0A9X1M7Q0_9MICC|nr:M20/M25/M40 family metallo-hydrolase [Arthrobacter zhangbolii]MCC3272988.1 M20/M25/M40 family metallo-hydrolase [Arthrobacter zhangbolii]UON93036.1 M20/M25/M40 family metallo-hydrolase [Arthrobacter zhangbolii]